MSTIFTKIIHGEIPSYKIYEDDFVFAFLDVFPQQDGHTLIVPKSEIDHFSDLDDVTSDAMFRAAKKISKAITKATNCKRVCASFVGYEVPHCHFHLIPTNDISEATFRETERANDEKLAEIQQKILKNLD